MSEHIMVTLMAQMTHLTDEEKIAIEKAFPVKIFDKGTYLLRQGEVAKDAYYVVKGCIREFKLTNGSDHTTAFYTEEDSAVNFESIASEKPSNVSFICMETCETAIVNAKAEKKFYKAHPRFESFCREGVEQMMGSKQGQLTELITLKPEQRYLKLQQERPDLINRVPQYQIASYLGIKPETLSRIRSRLADQ